jgi:hypothetical protein
MRLFKTADQAPEKVRFQLDLSPEQMDRIAELMGVCDLSSRKDLFNNAMSLFEWAVDEVRKGNIIASYNVEANQYVELRMPALSHAAKRTPRDKASHSTD